MELTSYDNTTDFDEGSDEEDFIESFATSMIKKGDIAIIHAGDDHLYHPGTYKQNIQQNRSSQLPT